MGFNISKNSKVNELEFYFALAEALWNNTEIVFTLSNDTVEIEYKLLKDWTLCKSTTRKSDGFNFNSTTFCDKMIAFEEIINSDFSNRKYKVKNINGGRK